MKRFYVETEDYSMVVFTDDINAYAFYDTAFDEPLTLDVAKNADYSNCDNCETPEDINSAVGHEEMDHIFAWNPDEFRTVIEF